MGTVLELRPPVTAAPQAPSGDPPADDRGYYSISQTAALLGVSRVSVSRWIRAGHLPVARLGHRTARVSRDDVERLLAESGLEASRPWTGKHFRTGRSSAAGADHSTAAVYAPLATWRGLAESEHVVQFYEQDAFLLDAVAAFLGAALHAGGAGIVIATPEHRDGIAQRLRVSGEDLAAAGARGRYVVLDAAETLAQFMVDGAPDRERFVEVVGEVVGHAGRGGRPVRAFGEMVALLVDEGNPAAALRLEQLWNDLGQTHAFSLFCAYPMDRFGGGARAGLLHEVCAAHSSVIPAESYTVLPTPGDRLRAIAVLQQKAQSLAAEVAERTRVEEQLRLALAERDRLLEAEQAAREQAEAAVRVRDEFLSIAAHELRTPLTSVVGQAQFLLRRYERGGQLQPEQVARALAAIQSQGGRLSRLISQLMDVSRLEAGRMVLEGRPTDLAQLVEEAVSAARVWSERHTITVTAVPSDRPVEVTLDRLRIEQVLNNLLENAVKYNPDGGTIEVALAQLAQTEQEWAEISVRDHGPGIPAGQRGRLFERLYQAHANGHRSGLGLGLYVSRQIVERHGGRIWAEFPPDGGARFVVRLPLHPVAPVAAE